MALPRVVSEIFNVEKYHDLEILAMNQSRSLKVACLNTSCHVFYFYTYPVSQKTGHPSLAHNLAKC